MHIIFVLWGDCTFHNCRIHKGSHSFNYLSLLQLASERLFYELYAVSNKQPVHPISLLLHCQPKACASKLMQWLTIGIYFHIMR